MLRSALLILFAALPLAAQTNAGIWLSRASTGTTHESGGDIRFRDGSGYGVSIARRFGSHLGFEVAVHELRKRGSVEFAGADALDLGRLRMRPISLAAQWHFSVAYLGGGIAYVMTDDLSSSDLDLSGIGTVAVASGYAPMANGGIDFAVGRSVAVAIDVKYIRFRADSGPPDARVRLRLDPLIASAGLRFRF